MNYPIPDVAHSPLKPVATHLASCAHIENKLRQEFCGMVVGLDEALKNISSSAIEYLGQDTLLVFSSDNGGSPWFGGLNYPFRGTKGSAYEGGINVPAFIVDFTEEKKYIGRNVNCIKDKPCYFNSMIHCSDWYPTILSYANISGDASIDGIDFKSAIYSNSSSNSEQTFTGPRQGFLIDMYSSEETPLNEDLAAYRLGNFKYIRGAPGDGNYYFETHDGFLNISKASEGVKRENNFFLKSLQSIIFACEQIFGNSRFDLLKIIIVHLSIRGKKDQRQLFNIAIDPLETTNLADNSSYAQLIIEFENILEKIDKKRQKNRFLNLQLPIRGDIIYYPHKQ